MTTSQTQTQPPDGETAEYYIYCPDADEGKYIETDHADAMDTYVAWALEHHIAHKPDETVEYQLLEWIDLASKYMVIHTIEVSPERTVEEVTQ